MPLFGRRASSTGRRQAASNPNDTDVLTASGQKVDRVAADSLRRVLQPWQFRALDYYNACGPAWYAGQFYARMLAPLRIYAAEKDENGEIKETTNPVAIEQLDRVQDPGGGRSGLLGAYGRLYFLTGEGRLFCSADKETGIEEWEMLSVRELRIESDVLLRYRSPGAQPQEYKQPSDDDNKPLQPGEGVVYRLWRRHPEFSDEADAPMRAVLDDLEELLLLTRAVRSRARSRLAGPGMLFIDDRISRAPPEPVGDEAPMEDIYLRDITEAMTAPMANEGVASEVVPILTRVPVPEGMSLRDMVYHLQVIDPNDFYPETGLRMECLQRIAIGLDMPPEVLMGIADLNHWSGWLVDEATWKGHGEPIAQGFCDDLTSAFFRPTLKALNVPNWERFVVAYDDAEVVNHPDRSRDAKELHDRGVLSDAALREANNFGDEEEPSEEERRVWLAVHARDPQFALTGETAPAQTSGQATQPAQEPIPGGGAAEAPGAAPDLPQAQTASGNGHHPSVARVIGAADLALHRCRQAAGSRVRSLAKRDPELLRLLEDVSAGQVCAVLGRERVHNLGAPAEGQLVMSAKDLLNDAFRSWGVNEPEIVKMIAEAVEQHAARTLYQEKPARIPPPLANYIAGLSSGLPVGIGV